MTINENVELTPEEKATNDLRAAMDSVDLVNKLVSSSDQNPSNASEQVLNSLDRNYRHVEIVLKREWVVANNTSDKTPFTSAVTVAKAYITTAKSENNANAAVLVVV